MYAIWNIKASDIAAELNRCGTYEERKILSAAEKLGYTTVMWTKDTIDWKYSDEQTIYDKATKNIQNGDIILIHPKTHTAKVLDRILSHFEEVGMDVVTVAECLE